jgi:pimeloyl-ACP methyl ester carboxylesterase
MNVERFRIDVPDETLTDLKIRLGRTRWPDEGSNANEVRGTSLSYLQKLSSYWVNEYNWRQHELHINQFEQFTAVVSGFKLHFIHIKGTGSNPTSLIMTHGWPSSFVGMRRIIPFLTGFDLVIPSLPGFGFSEKPSASGMSIFRIAELWTGLMEGLGYSRFATYGEDWGAYVSAALGSQSPQKIIGNHLSFVPGGIKPELSPPSRALSTSESDFLAEQARWESVEGAYEHLQGTKPQTLAYGLTDSPIGLAAWMIEKFRSWSDCNGDIESCFSKDDLLTNIMIYWITKTAGSSARLYYETQRSPWIVERNQKMLVPTSVTLFPRDFNSPPKEWVERMYNVVRWNNSPNGGHFPAWEAPEFLASEIRASFEVPS